MNQGPFQRLYSLFEPVLRRHEHVQAAALCLRDTAAGREVLLVSSLNTGRWILPKGWPMQGRTLASAASQEAWEEAGVVGRADETPVGYYTYEKTRKSGPPVTCRVEVFRITVAELARDWPERARRKRSWMSLDRAADAVDEPDLKVLLRRQ